jgi:type VI secretion system protein ImpH
MANAVSLTPQAMTEALGYVQQHYKRFSFFQLCGLLESIAFEQHKKVRYHFKSNPALTSPSADVASVSLIEDEYYIDAEIMVNFMGLMGAASPLPIHYTEQLLHNEDEGQTLVAFYDFFNQRLIELRYRIWQKYRYLQSYRLDGQDSISRDIGSLCGLAGLPIESASLSLQSLYPFIPVLLGKRVDEQHISSVLESYFRFTRVRLVKNQLRRSIIPLMSRCLLGRQSSCLGKDSIAGAVLYDRQYHFSVQIYLNNPLAFLPYQLAFQQLLELIRYLVRAPLTFDLQLHSEVDLPPVLSRSTHSYLGWTMRLSSRGHKKPLVIPLSVK